MCLLNTILVFLYFKHNKQKSHPEGWLAYYV